MSVRGLLLKSEPMDPLDLEAVREKVKPLMAKAAAGELTADETLTLLEAAVFLFEDIKGDPPTPQTPEERAAWEAAHPDQAARAAEVLARVQALLRDAR